MRRWLVDSSNVGNAGRDSGLVGQRHRRKWALACVLGLVVGLAGMAGLAVAGEVTLRHQGTERRDGMMTRPIAASFAGNPFLADKPQEPSP
jgi:hypothetical protein